MIWNMALIQMAKIMMMNFSVTYLDEILTSVVSSGWQRMESYYIQVT